MSTRNVRSLLAVAALAVAALAGADAAPAQAPVGPTELLPNLNQEIPGDFSLRRFHKGRTIHFRLGFSSQVDNMGTGPVEIVGHRASRSVRNMTADQVILRSDGSTVTKPAVGVIGYGRPPDHEHWHFVGFELYELRRASDNKLVRTSPKVGNCMDDGSNPDPMTLMPGEPAQPVFGTTGFPDCAMKHPELLTITTGISVGWGDAYEPHVEGQSFDLTGVPSGRYVVVHSSNVKHLIRESDYTDNFASTLIQVTWSKKHPRKAPRIKTLRGCSETARCR